MENMKVEVTCDLIDFASNELGLICHREELFGRDLCRFKYGWLSRTSSRNQQIMLDYCNISSQGYWYVFDELDMSTKRHIYELNG